MGETTEEKYKELNWAVTVAQQYTVAKAAAERVQRKLGSDWRVGLFENVGWHASVWHKSGRLTVSIHIKDRRVTSYTAFANIDGESEQPPSGGEWIATERTAQKAIAVVKKRARNYMEDLKRMLDLSA